MKNLSIIIVSFNTKKILANCLNYIYPIVKNSQNEIIVIDNNSTDGTKEMLKNQYPRIQTIFNNNNLGFGTANNQGMRIAKGNFFLLLNSDTIALPENIERSKQYLINRPDVGILGCRLETPAGYLQPSCGSFFTLYHAIFGGIELNRILKKLGFFNISVFEHILAEDDHQIIRDVDWVSGAFMLLRKEVFEKVGGFDENIFFYGEEDEWCYRIKKYGWKILYFPEVSIVHIGKVSVVARPDLRKNSVVLERKYYFFKKHFGIFKAETFRFLIFLFALIKLVIWLIVYILLFRSSIKRKILFQLNSIRWFLHLDRI